MALSAGAGLAVVLFTFASPATGAEPAPSRPANPTSAPNGEGSEVVQLSPFEVVSENRGYYASNTMSGTRLNSKLEDLAASISVVTKEQMEDFALLDVNDIFNYEANTEGTGNFTDFSFNLSGNPVDNVQMDPQVANRIRGLGAANMTLGNFETSGRVPIDPVNVDSVEISRGPNSSIFGIGSPSGTVNSVPASANLTRNSSTVTGRADSRDGWRTSLDLNRVLRKGQIAIRGSAVLQHDGFALKPSGVDTQRLNAMIKVRPFKSTTLSASYSYYKANGSRPNAGPPRDGITGWLQAGSPTWDPVTSTAKINGVAVGTFPADTPGYFNLTGAGMMAYIDQAGLSYLGTGRGTNTGTPATNTPLSQTQAVRLMAAKADPTGVLAAQPLLQDYPVLGNRSLYDWSSVNIAAQNRFEDKAAIASVLLDHVFIETGRQTLALQLGWFRELTDRYQRNLMGTASASQGFAPTVSLDVNERLLDGRPNPYFLRPFINLSLPQTFQQPLDRDTYRAQLAYRLDFRPEKNWTRWLGAHQLSGYAEYKDIQLRNVAYRDAIVDSHPWIPASLIRGSSGAVTLMHRFYVGDSSGNNVDYAPTAFNPGRYVLNWGNGVTGQFTPEPVVIGTSVSDDQTGANRNSWTILKSQGGVLQSHLLQDRLVTTFGVRQDQRYSRFGTAPSIPDALNLDYNRFNEWASGDWGVGKGQTTTAGAVVKPLRWLSVFLNRSNSFQPADIALNLNREVLPDPTGRGEDYGIALNLFDGKLVVRANRYKTLQINSRNGDSANIAQRGYRMDFQNATGMAFNFQRKAIEWVNTLTPGLSAEQVNQRVADIMKYPVEFVRDASPRASAVDDLTARGTEVEINYNPTKSWTMKLNVAQQESINAGLASEVGQWIEDRLVVWQGIIDPLLNRPWWTEPYGGQRPVDYFASNVRTPLQVAQAMQGKSRPQVRKYRANFATNYRLAGITEHPVLKRFNIGGALRWEDKGAIGYRGVEQLPAVITTLDVNRPVWDKARLNVDAFVGYRTRLFSDKIGVTLQVNARNLTEGGRLQPIAAEADGRIAAYRIIEPRLFIFSATFSM